MEQLILALDFGGTKHTAAVIARDERSWRSHERIFSPAGADAQYDIRTMLTLARKLLQGARPSAVGVSFGGPVDFSTGTVRLSHHVPAWENVRLKQLLEDEFEAPAVVDNDANAAALGEHRFGAGQGCASLFYLTVSTGVGGGWVLNGRPWRGWEGMAGEIGHVVVDPDGPACLCGKHGCVERLASGVYMAQDARLRLQEGSAPHGGGHILLDLAGGDPAAITGQTLSASAAKGDSLAWEILERGARALGMGIGNTANLINPELFVLGGGVTKAGERYWEAIRRTARLTALPEVHFQIVPARLGDDAPLWGALALAEDCLA
jgi:glucokinase